MAPTSTDATVSALTKLRVLRCIKCFKCNKIVRNGILCDSCDRWYHFKCANIAEEDIPNEDSEWNCMSCTSVVASIVKDTEASAATVSENRSLESVINSLREENLSLLKQIKTLKDNCEQSDYALSKALEIKTDIKIDNRPSLTCKPSSTRGWECVPTKRRSIGPKSNLDVNFPELKNSFSVLEQLESEQSVIISSDAVTPNKRPATRQSGRPRPKQGSTKTGTINLYADSHGRDMAKLLSRRCNHSIDSIFKPNASMDSATQGIRSKKMVSSDVAVLLAGTNDIARNETQGMLSSLRRNLSLLHESGTNTLVFSPTHRYDLPEWSCVNAEVRKGTDEMRKICKHFKNVKFVDLSRIGQRFHTKHGLHLSRLGKNYLCNEILEFTESVLNDCNAVTQAIPLALPPKNCIR